MTTFQNVCSRRVVSTASALLLALVAHPSFAARPDPVVATFATVGDSRAEPGPDLSGQDRIWLQNTKALSRILNEIQARKPQALFFNGDMIMGYTTDKNALNKQYAFWRGMTANLMEKGIYVVPVSGNHEVQEKYKDGEGKIRKVSRVDNEDSWRENMGDLIIDEKRWKSVVGSEISAFDAANSPAVGGSDSIKSSQKQLSYSFDFAGSHFAVINTDAVGNEGRAPGNWLQEDFAKAKARGAKRFFVFGHKPAFTYMYKPNLELDGMDIYPENQKQFWQVVEDYRATYFCGHQHTFNISQPEREHGGKAFQVIVGSGGSPFVVMPGETNNPQDRMYAWAVVKVHASGKVHLDAYGFDDHYGKTTLLKSMDF